MLPDLSRPVVYRNIDFNDTLLVGNRLIGNSVTRFRLTGVEGIGYTEKRAGSDGLNASDVWQAGRTVVMECMTYAASRGDLSDRMQNNIAALTPRSAYAEAPGDKGFVPLSFFAPSARIGDMVIDGQSVPQWPTGEIECFVRARPKAQPQFVTDRDSSGGDDNDPLALPWNVTFVCIDPRIYISPRIDINVASVAGDHTYRRYNRGTYPAPVNTEIVIPAGGGPASVTLSGAGTTILLTIPNDAAKSRVVRVSSNDQIVTSQLDGGVQTLAMDFINQVTNRVWPIILPGGYADIRVVSDKTLATNSTVWYYEAFA